MTETMRKTEFLKGMAVFADRKGEGFAVRGVPRLDARGTGVPIGTPRMNGPGRECVFYAA